jgi:hypothetical protein
MVVEIPDSLEGEFLTTFIASVPRLPLPDDPCQSVLRIPVLIQSSSADAAIGAEAVRLRWVIGETQEQRANLYRSSDDGPWTRLAEVVARGDTLEYEDTEVRTGLRYSYRLGIRSAGHEVQRGLVSVTVPGRMDFGLVRVWPNPVVGTPAVAFSLPRSAAATLDLYDISGRRVLSRQVGALGPGTHRLELTGTAGLSGGLYFLRLEQGGRSTTRRLCLLR